MPASTRCQPPCPVSADAGTRWRVADTAGKPLRAWDSRGHTLSSKYDALQRPTHMLVDSGSGNQVMTRTVYGEALDPIGPAPTDASSASPAQALNLRGRPYLLFDGAGLVASDSVDFKGNVTQARRRIATEYLTTPHWTALTKWMSQCGVGASQGPWRQSNMKVVKMGLRNEYFELRGLLSHRSALRAAPQERPGPVGNNSVSDMAERETSACTFELRATTVELRTRPAYRKSWYRSSSTYRYPRLQRSAFVHPNAFGKRAHQQRYNSPKPWLKCEFTRQSTELGLGNPPTYSNEPT